MHKMKLNIICVLAITLISKSNAWDNDQLEVFDVVEEVKENFYEFLNLTQNASHTQVKSAFRRLTLLWHPDKNLNEDTSEKFRNLVSVYDVLKDDKKRAYYDDVLVNGLPNWKSAMYYYRRVRKMELFEGLIIILAFFTIGQYLVAWAAYFERKYTLEQQSKPKGKKYAQQGPVIIDLEKPSVFNTLPVQIPKLVLSVIISIPSLILLLKNIIATKIHESSQQVEDEESEEEIQPKIKSKKKKHGFVIPEGPSFEPLVTENASNESIEPSAPIISGGFWSDDDLDELVQLVKKFPGGTTGRWEIIAENMNRSVAEVTFMANKLKNTFRTPQNEESPEEIKVKQKTKGGKLGLEGQGEGESQGFWNKEQQRALEDALRKYSKGVADRWDRIAEMVPNKTRDECVLRFKYLAESIKKQKEL